METLVEMEPLFAGALREAGYRRIVPDDGGPAYFFRRLTVGRTDFEFEVLMLGTDEVLVEIHRISRDGTRHRAHRYPCQELRRMPESGIVLFFTAVLNSALDSTA